ncbi:antibiotic biosynthesis monooxygenase [Sphingopyxis lindanitolerans]|uniref:Antibiotic biosynthesis monooxygenase n=1 Tax=Sphingopyxis lindanitolerans TaxID=2054227 RepID=A0A2S8B510_9SPHN|nr:antibiotic biosynthesis monooxygenase [Sphingopyxis lindanitolerans]PQM27492.1 antibiotic biosynthesis monooxygenase [Sphingopyxis lindanitolerans]
MSIALTANFVVKDGMDKEFQAIVLDLAGQVLEKEPGVRMYQLCRSQTLSGQYRLFEVYDNAEVLAAHSQTEWFKALGPKLGACLAEKPMIEKFDFVQA